MRIIYLFLLPVLLCAPAFADPSTQDEKEFLMPPSNAVSGCTSTKINDFSGDTIPAGLKDALYQLADWGDNGLPADLRSYQCDLDDDVKTDEYLIANPVLSGSGGTYYLIIQKNQNDWKRIGEFQGRFYLLPAKDNWHRILSISRGGAGHYTKIFSEFKDGFYQQTRVEKFEPDASEN